MKKIKLYTFGSRSYRCIQEMYFEPSLQDDYEIIAEGYENQDYVEGAAYGTAEFNDAMILKTDLILRAIRENWGEIFIYSDVDVQFFRPTKDMVLKLMRGRDLVIQRDSPLGFVCAGFFAARGNRKNLRLWEKIRQRAAEDRTTNDQIILNDILWKRAGCIPFGVKRVMDFWKRRSRSHDRFESYDFFGNAFGVRWTYLPARFYSGGNVRHQHWNPGDRMDIPADIVMHHANWTYGIANKMAQLQYVRHWVEQERVPS